MATTKMGHLLGFGLGAVLGVAACGGGADPGGGAAAGGKAPGSAPAASSGGGAQGAGGAAAGPSAGTVATGNGAASGAPGATPAAPSGGGSTLPPSVPPAPATPPTDSGPPPADAAPAPPPPDGEYLSVKLRIPADYAATARQLLIAGFDSLPPAGPPSGVYVQLDNPTITAGEVLEVRSPKLTTTGDAYVMAVLYVQGGGAFVPKAGVDYQAQTTAAVHFDGTHSVDLGTLDLKK